MPATFEINGDEPPKFSEKYVLRLQIHYEIDDGVYIFRYRARNALKGDPDNVLTEIESDEWSLLRKGRVHPVPSRSLPILGFASEPLDEDDAEIFVMDLEYKAYIDIPIPKGDTTVYIETVGNGNYEEFYWSKTRPALLTARKRHRAYGQILYWNGEAWRPERPQNIDCRQMCFKARYNRSRSLYRDRNHGFGLNVRLRDENRRLISLLIDPDIKNPSLDE